ncbi:MAG: glycosyltransferase, partial [Candidatus Rokuibacteriota bacterium]
MSRPLRIAHVVRSLERGGLENGVVNLVNGLRPGLEHVVVCTGQTGPLARRLPPEVQVVALGVQGRDHSMLLRLASLFRRLKPDVVHSRNWPAIEAIPAAWLARVPVILHGEHGREAADPDGRNRKRNRLRRLFSPLL